MKIACQIIISFLIATVGTSETAACNSTNSTYCDGTDLLYLLQSKAAVGPLKGIETADFGSTKDEELIEEAGKDEDNKTGYDDEAEDQQDDGDSKVDDEGDGQDEDEDEQEEAGGEVGGDAGDDYNQEERDEDLLRNQQKNKAVAYSARDLAMQQEAVSMQSNVHTAFAAGTSVQTHTRTHTHITGTLLPSSSSQGSFLSLFSQRAGKDLIPIRDVCSKFKLDQLGCLRVEAYVGKTLLNLKARLHLELKVHDQAGDVTSKEGLGNPSVSSGYGRKLREVADSFKSLPVEMATNPFILAGDDMAYLKPWLYPTLVRPAPVPDPRGNHVIVRMDRGQHEDTIATLASIDIPFQDKWDVLVWRGSTTGQVSPSPCHSKWLNRSRMLLVQKHCCNNDARIDVAFAGNLVKGVPPNWKRARMELASLLKNKFIMVVDGNAEATSTEWVMASNSVPFMAPPVIQTWSLHSWLQPWKHYVPLEPDFSDVSSKLDWAISNPEEAAQIAAEGAAFMKEFDDKDREERINAAVLATYLDRVKIESAPVETSLVGELVPTQCSGQQGGSYVLRNLFDSLRFVLN